MYSVLVFSRTKRGADRINRRLKAAGVVSVSIHSGRTQGQRLLAMDGFRKRSEYNTIGAFVRGPVGRRCSEILSGLSFFQVHLF